MSIKETRSNTERQNLKKKVINRVVLASTPQGVSYGDRWGVRVAVTPDGNYIGVAFSEYNTYHLWVVILDKNGNIVRKVNLSQVAVDYGLVNQTNVYRGTISIAANNSCFLVAWTQWSTLIGITTRYNITLHTFIPIDPTKPIPYDTSLNQFFYAYSGSHQYHPLVVNFKHANGTEYWIIGYGYQSTNRSWYYLNLIDNSTLKSIRSFGPVLSGGNASDVRVGVDVMGGMIYDNKTKSFIVIARNKTTDHNIIAIHSTSDSTQGFYTHSYTVDSRTGDQGPDTDLGVDNRSLFNVYPTYTALLGSGGYTLTVYNETASALAYAVVDLSTRSVTGPKQLLDYGEAITFYPWIAGGSDKWLVAYSARGYVNITFIDINGDNTELVPLADRNAGYVRVAYDSGSGLFPVVYAVRDLVTRNYNAFITLVGENGDIGVFVIPINNSGATNVTPVNIVVLPGVVLVRSLCLLLKAMI